MKLAVAIQNLQLESNDFRKLSNFEISLCIINNRKLVKKKKRYCRIVWNISLSPFLKIHFPLQEVEIAFIFAVSLSSSLQGGKIPWSQSLDADGINTPTIYYFFSLRVLGSSLHFKRSLPPMLWRSLVAQKGLAELWARVFYDPWL